MGYYIQGPNHGKAEMLLAKEDAIQLANFNEAKKAFEQGMGVVVVVDNGPFEAAGFAFSLDELEVFGNPKDHRPKVWLAMDRKRAEELSGYKR